MVKSVQQIKFEVLAYIKEFGGDFSDWYLGISEDPMRTLFETHKVDKEADSWLYRQALSFGACRTLAQYFLGTLQVDGVLAQRGEEDLDCVYLYKKSERTVP